MDLERNEEGLGSKRPLENVLLVWQAKDRGNGEERVSPTLGPFMAPKPCCGAAVPQGGARHWRKLSDCFYFHINKTEPKAALI